MQQSQQEEEQQGVYRIGTSKKLFGAKVSVLPGAVAPLSSKPSLQTRQFGWVKGGLPVPATGGFYAVEFLQKSKVKVLAYIDPFGRAFSVDDAIVMPPARTPDLAFASLSPSSGNEETGVVCVYDTPGDDSRELARYRSVGARYSLFDSWYCFEPYGAHLCYEEAVARAYFAFVHRPSLGGRAVPSRGLAYIHSQLLEKEPLEVFFDLTEEVEGAKDDPVFQPPALVRCLVHWLDEAGFDILLDREIAADALRLVHTVRYANTYYLAPEGEAGDTIPGYQVWALEAALNRFLLIEEALGDEASLATEQDCVAWDKYLIDTVAKQQPSFVRAPLVDGPDIPVGKPGGEWDLRCSLGVVLERLRLPVRIAARIDCDVEVGAVAFEVEVPDGTLMPASTWDEDSGWQPLSETARDAQARHYALHLGLLLAAAAFEASPEVRRVDMVLRPFGVEEKPLESMEESRKEDEEIARRAASPLATERDRMADRIGKFYREGHRTTAWCQVSFDRGSYEGFNQFEAPRAEDPLPPYVVCGAWFDIPSARGFDYLEAQKSSTFRREVPEMIDVPLPADATEILAAQTSADLRINYNAALRHKAEELADTIAATGSTSEAIRIVRAAQDEAHKAQDDRMEAACTRLMAALVAGELDEDDQNALVSCFLGEDRCLAALGRANKIAQRDPQKAADILIEAVKEAEALDGFVDGSTTVYRAFDAYAGRLLYNRARQAAKTSSTELSPLDPARVADEVDKRVALVPDSFYMCHLEIVRLLDQSFERADEALHYGQRAIEMAPATAAGYRQLGRAFMLMGDMESAADTLMAGLRIGAQPNDIALAYYQLAYVLWKTGRLQASALCYVKSMIVSPVAAMQASAELHELASEEDVVLPERDSVDEGLVRYGIPLVPTKEMMTAFINGAAAATDANLFPVARMLLALCLHYHPNDALVDVMRSLGNILKP